MFLKKSQIFLRLNSDFFLSQWPSDICEYAVYSLMVEAKIVNLI
jgi:hypothetical protein